jgi:nucleotide-binding universal stress UspA family protein
VVISRRNILSASAALPFFTSVARAAGTVTISVDASRTVGVLAPDYMGLGYEISSVAIPGLLSAKNTSYVGLVKALGARGVIRIGGNTSDFATYAANGTPVSSPKGTVVTDTNLTELRGFLDALDWKLIWGLNLGSDKLDNAVEEARAVARIFGDRLIALEVGNEPDLFARSGHRPADYNYDAWLKDYRRYKAAIRAALPRAAFAGPDLAADAGWMTRFAHDEGGDIALLTAHHYVTGQDKPDATHATLLAPEKKFIGSLATFREAAKAAGKPWRMVETNSFYGGGKDGVSNSYASALWALDYLLVLAGYGCAGVNMETGVNHLGKISYYTPINDDLKGNYAAAPEYYGLKAFAQLPKGELLGVECQTGGLNLTAHAVRQGRELCVTVINKDAAGADATIRVSGYGSGRILRLTGPEPEGRDGMLLGGVPVAANGAWNGAKYEPVRVANGSASLHVPATSAALVWLS